MENETKKEQQNQEQNKNAVNHRAEAQKIRLGSSSSHESKIELSEKEKTPVQDKEFDQKKPVEEEKETDVTKETEKDNSEIDLLKKRYEDNRAYAREMQRQLASTKSKIKELAESGDLDEETAKSLIETMASSPIKQPDDLKAKIDEAKGMEPKGLFAPLFKQLTPDLLDQYLEVSDDKKTEYKVAAFDRLISESSEEEQKALFEKVMENGKTPMQILKAMLRIGEEFLSEGFEEYIQSGGLKKYTSTWKEKTEKQQKEIDRLQKKLKEYEVNFDKPERMTLGSSYSGGDVSDGKFDPRKEAQKIRSSQMRPLS